MPLVGSGLAVPTIVEGLSCSGQQGYPLARWLWTNPGGEIAMRARTDYGSEFIDRAMAALNSADRNGFAITGNSSVSNPSRRA
jgi:hypothetical protein